jgi:hypothetical protein
VLPPSSDGKVRAVKLHFKQPKSLEERLAAEAKLLREQAQLLQPGDVREATLRRAGLAETGAHISEWLRSPGLRPPTR